MKRINKINMNNIKLLMNIIVEDLRKNDVNSFLMSVKITQNKYSKHEVQYSEEILTLITGITEMTNTLK